MQWCSTEWVICTEFRVSINTQCVSTSGHFKLLLWNQVRTASQLLRFIVRWAMRVFAVGRLLSRKIFMRKASKFTRKSRGARVLRFLSFTTTWATFTSSSLSSIKPLISTKNVSKSKKSSKVRPALTSLMFTTILARFTESLRISLKPKSSTICVSRSRQRSKESSAITRLQATLTWVSFTLQKVYQKTEPKMTMILQWGTLRML